MHGAFCGEARPDNDPGYDPDLLCAVSGGDTGHTGQTMRLPNVLRRCGTFPREGNIFLRSFARVKQIP